MGNDMCNFCTERTEEGEAFRNRSDIINDISEKRTENSSLRISQEKPVGLQNLNNTCYMAAVLQIMFVVIPEKDNWGNGNVTRLFFELRKSKSLSIYKMFRKELENDLHMVRTNDQQDAQEFLLHFLEILNIENSLVSHSPKKSLSLDYIESESIEENYRRFKGQMAMIENSPIVTQFSGDLLRNFICPNEHTKHKIERYQCLSLAFPHYANGSAGRFWKNDTSSIKLTELINNEFDGQIIEDLFCEKCGRKTNFRIKTQVITTPKHLILHLSRFKSAPHEKILTPLSYDSHLNLGEGKIYRLVGTVNHQGSLNRGHFFSKVRLSNGTWYEVNDEVVNKTEMKDRDNVSETVYILFYEKF